MTTPRLFSFVGGNTGDWRVTRMTTIAGEPLPAIRHLSIVPEAANDPDADWVLRGITSNERYVTRDEKQASWPARKVWAGRTPCAPP